MGNVCVKEGFIFLVTRSLGRSKLSDNKIEDESKEGSNYAASNVKQIDRAFTVEDKPPGVVKMVEKDQRKLEESLKPHQHVVVILKNEDDIMQVAKWEGAVKSAVEDEKFLQISRPQSLGKPVTDKKHKEIEFAKTKKPHNVKRMASAGLQAESVLITKTGHLKEYYNLGDKLGHGQYGTTFMCTEKGTGKQYACKSIAKRKLEVQEDIDDVRREIKIMHHLSGHKNVISIKGSYEDAVAVHIVMELCTGGELFDRIVKLGHYTERKAAQLARTIVGVVETCHSLGVMHRDLKPENFLFVNEDDNSPLKIIDFGLSMFFKPGEILTDMVGSPYYVAPEVLDNRYGPEADIWSAGVIIYILLSGTPPFWGETEDEIFSEIRHGNIDYSSDPWPNISESSKDLVRRMLERDPKKRITSHEVLCHPWVQVDGVAPDKPLDEAVFDRLKQFSDMDRLKKMALRVIAENLSEEETGGLKEMFKMIDTDSSGHITPEELKAGLKRFGTSLDESEINDLMQIADVNRSGHIEYVEFIAATLHLNKIEKDRLLHTAFSYFDKDDSGFITRDELQKACNDFGIEPGCLEEMIRETDQNNDGCIDYNEFVALMQRGNVDLDKQIRKVPYLSSNGWWTNRKGTHISL
ncbi:non-receptor serine/threonine protein kinase [Lithospermum erythrorhizon]|uniref:non-specific serine/threonine protein kinase n=1 Tax=Lithospermum erythrorhizon TaxID=34254 RepID=A0AAV3Q9Z8_LITER